MHRIPRCFTVTTLALHVLCMFDASPELYAADAPPINPSALNEVLGTPADWKLSPEIPAAGAVLSLESKAPREAPCELLMSFRLKPAAGASSTIGVQMACADLADKSHQALTLSVSAAGGTGYISYGVSVTASDAPEALKAKPPPSLNGYLYFDAVKANERSLAWSDDMRRMIEAQIAAAPKVEETPMTLRCTVEKDRFRCWINGRFVSELPIEPGMNPSGLVRVQIYPGAEVTSLKVLPLAADSHRFEPISISGNLNSSTLNGGKVDRASLPGGGAPDAIVSAGNVPFQFPALSANGNDHVDVGQSWTRFGALPGFFAANSGTFGGRWISADRMDPARIATYIPKGRYKALHMLAVADDRENGVPVVSAQIYRPDAGHPFNFSAKVPKEGGGGESVPIKLAGGKSARLYHVTVPMDPDAFSWFTDLQRIGLEITKQVQYYRAYPDPLEYSWHGAGLPSSVQIYAMTLERVGVDVDIEPEHFGHFWTAPETPKYTVTLRNGTGKPTTAKLLITTRSDGGKNEKEQKKEVPLPADNTPVKVPIELAPTRYGLQEMTLSVTAGDEIETYRRKYSWLHPDTRDHDIWQSGRGSIFGYWEPGGAHDTPTQDKAMPMMAAAGAETSLADYSETGTPEMRAMAEKYHFVTEPAFSGGMFYCNAFVSPPELVAKYDPTKPEESGKALIEVMRKYKIKPSPTCRPTYLPFFPEPLIGPVTAGVWPTHYGVDYKLSPEDQKTFDAKLTTFLIGARAVRKEWPDVKLLLPYGDPMFTAIFMRLSPEAREFIDGCAIDLPGFERLPEQQVHQVDFNRLCPIMKDIRQYKPDPYLVVVEGTSVSSRDLDTGEEEQADICTRDFLNLIGYGVTRFESSDAPFDCAGYWGENHYGGGWCNRKPMCTPKLAYINYATLTRHINRANFTKYLPTGSTSTYCQQYKHYKTGKLIHVLWTIRGKRIVSVKVPSGATLEIYDQHDNATPLREKNGVVTFVVDRSPQYLEGLASDAEITLGDSDHSDSRPGKEIEKLSNIGEGWKVVEKEDLDYAKNKPLMVERFLGKMSAKKVDAPGDQGGKALAIHLEKQAKDRGVMPFYTTLEPDHPITIEGKASHLGLWVHAASDWGRVVYFLRDAKGEKWISVGAKEDWNDDDIHCWSAFCFDGWRYLRFELPSNAPYDCFREYGSTWWGSYEGDGVVDLPLKLEKIAVERRPKVICGNELVDAKPDDVLLGDLNAEYANASDKDDDAVKLSRLRMPATKDAPELGNPIADFAKAGVGAPTKVLKVADPQHQYDGTRCHVHFDLVPGAKSYNVWVSPYADGRGAMQLGTGWTESGKMIEGLRPDIQFHVFVVYTDKDDKPSKPSAPLAFTLKDRFGYK